jgi:hypothetical protein
MMLGALSVALAVVFAACAGEADGQSSDEGFRKIQLGMSEAQVTEILGKPDEAWTHPQTDLRMMEWGGDSRVVLTDGKVTAVVLHEDTILEEPTSESDE